MPGRRRYTILLTNRVYPSDKDIRIEALRKQFNTAVVAAVGNSSSSSSTASNSNSNHHHYQQQPRRPTQ